MALKDKPYLPLYIKDVLTDEKLIECSAIAHGVYFRLLCILHKQPEYGKFLLKQKYKQKYKQNPNQILNFAYQLAKQLPFSEQEIRLGLSELLEEKVLFVDGDNLCQKRMIKDNELSEVRASVGSKGGKQTQKKKKNTSKEVKKFASDFALAKVKANTGNGIGIDNGIVNDNVTGNAKKRKKPDLRITRCVEFLESKLGHSLDKSKQSNRNLCRTCLNKLEKDYPNQEAEQNLKLIIEHGLRGWHGKNMTNFQYIYNHLNQIANGIKEEQTDSKAAKYARAVQAMQTKNG